MTSVTVEGSLTPCTELARGERRTVQLTERVQRLIDRGYFNLIETHDTPAVAVASEDESTTPEGESSTPEVHDHAPGAEGGPDAQLEPPARNASTAAWQAWFTSQGLDYPAEAGRDDLVAAWSQITQQQADGNG